MSEFFADTSAIVKLYVAEAGSSWVHSWGNRVSGNIIVISQVTSIEVVSALSRRQREGKIVPADFITLRGAFLTDKDQFYLTIDIDDRLIIQARNLVAKHSLRTLDAIQLASALEASQLLGIRPDLRHRRHTLAGSGFC